MVCLLVFFFLQLREELETDKEKALEKLREDLAADEEKIRSELSEALNRTMKEDSQKLLETKVGEDNTQNLFVVWCVQLNLAIIN